MPFLISIAFKVAYNNTFEIREFFVAVWNEDISLDYGIHLQNEQPLSFYCVRSGSIPVKDRLLLKFTDFYKFE